MKNTNVYSMISILGFTSLLMSAVATAQVDREKLIQAATISVNKSTANAQSAVRQIYDDTAAERSLNQRVQIKSEAPKDLRQRLAPIGADKRVNSSENKNGNKTTQWHLQLLDQNVSNSAERSGKLQEAVNELNAVLKAPKQVRAMSISQPQDTVRDQTKGNSHIFETREQTAMSIGKDGVLLVPPSNKPSFQQRDKLKQAAKRFEDLFN